MTGRERPADRDHGGRGLKDADRTAGSTFEHYGWRDVYAALGVPGGVGYE